MREANIVDSRRKWTRDANERLKKKQTHKINVESEVITAQMVLLPLVLVAGAVINICWCCCHFTRGIIRTMSSTNDDLFGDKCATANRFILSLFSLTVGFYSYLFGRGPTTACRVQNPKQHLALCLASKFNYRNFLKLIYTWIFKFFRTQRNPVHFYNNQQIRSFDVWRPHSRACPFLHAQCSYLLSNHRRSVSAY